jgi:3-dehydroquinate dehydratase type I
MKDLKAEIQKLGRALSACLETIRDSDGPVEARVAGPLRASFASLCLAFKIVRPLVAPRICTAIMAPDTQTAKQAMRTAAADTDLLELRLDALAQIELEKLLPFSGKPVIVTNRKQEEGGHFKGAEPERLAYLQAAIALGTAYIDLEYRSPETWRTKLLHEKKSTEIILSYHDLQGTPGLPELLALWREMRRVQADYYKIITYARNPDDNLTLFNFLKELAPQDPRMICHAMGPAGLASRVLAPFFGSQWVYTAPPAGNRTAPGQLETGQMKRLWEIMRNASLE